MRLASSLRRQLTCAQVCERQMRDENGFKMHTQSESHVRRMLLVGEDPKKYINDYSNQFQKDFLLLLRTSHGEKQVQMNHFYQEYIANKEHVHMNSTKWPSLTEFAKHLGREGICRVEETDKGLHIAWVDNSPEALRRQDAVRRKEMQDKGDEIREQQLIKEQVKKAQADAEQRGLLGEDDDESRQLKRTEGEKIKLSFGKKSAAPVAQENTVEEKIVSLTPEAISAVATPAASTEPASAINEKIEGQADAAQTTTPAPAETLFAEAPQAEAAQAPAKISMKMGFSAKPKNVFAAAKKNALGGKKSMKIEEPKKMSEAERIMKEEIERSKRGRDGGGFQGGPAKRPRF